jgi:hypothetical protein
MSTGGAGGAGGVGAAAAVGSSGDSGGEGGEGYAGALDAFSEGELSSTSYLHNYVPNNEVQESSKPQDENKGRDEKQIKEKPKNAIDDHSDDVALSDEMVDDMQSKAQSSQGNQSNLNNQNNQNNQDDDDGHRPTSIWPPRRT